MFRLNPGSAGTFSLSPNRNAFTSKTLYGPVVVLRTDPTPVTVAGSQAANGGRSSQRLGYGSAVERT